jgi:hypothetical protein
MKKEKKIWRQYKLRLEPIDGRRLEDEAHAARLPVGIFVRQILLTGKAPIKAPPIPDKLSFGASHLLKICFALVSNLTQLEGHALKLGGPLQNLTGSESSLQRFANRVRDIGLNVKNGELKELEIATLISSLELVAQAVNHELARPLNAGKSVELEIWKRLLTELQSALTSSSVGAK